MATGRYVHRFDLDDRHSVHIYLGDLAEVQADALVSSDDNYLSAGGGVSAALAWVAGDAVARERLKLAREGRPRLSDVVRTAAGGLPCRLLYHAITIEDFKHYLNEPALRKLVANLLKSATEDGVRTLGMPALGAGAAGFDIVRASEVIIEELVGRLLETPVRHLILALVGDEAQRLFYEQLVRATAPRVAASSLRRIEQRVTEPIPPIGAGTAGGAWGGGVAGRVDTGATVGRAIGGPIGSVLGWFFGTGGGGKPPAPAEQKAPDPGPDDRAEITVEQFPSLVDETRVAAMPAGSPKLVAGLAALVLKHADAADVEQELLSRPESYGFRGTVEQRLTEFLYLGEKNLRTALGPALFKAKDLRRMADELGEDCEPARDPEQLIDLILRALGFNLLAPPAGLTQYVGRVERIILGLEGPDVSEAACVASGVEAAKLLEQVLKDLLRLYGLFLFGSGFEQELVARKLVEARRDGGVSRLTLGQAREALTQLDAAVRKTPDLLERLKRLGQQKPGLLPVRVAVERTGQAIDCGELLTGFIRWRNKEVVHDDPSAPPVPQRKAVRERLEHLRAFLLACRAAQVYPEVLRYEGTFENRNGERFVHFLDEQNTERKVRTDERIDPRRHYYCFATNNPLHLFPVLIQKL
jgi:O-acetyl-ADP-ribose deacetylase (regulator of RNase III)